MSIFIFYIIACLPVGIGFYLWLTRHEVVFWEWCAGAAAAFIIAGAGHYASVRAMTGDTQTVSGIITEAVRHPEWVEKCESTSTDSKGNKTTSTYYVTHPEHWTANLSTGGTVEMSEDRFQMASIRFGGAPAEWAFKSGFYSGDHNIYVAKQSKTGYLFPSTERWTFENRIKAAPSVFSFAKVPPNSGVYGYPPNGDFMRSDRLLGSAATSIPVRDFDLLNSELGPRKKVNLILIGFGVRPEQVAHWQQAAWIGGKKNDLVICYGGGTAAKPEWCYVFGWTESELCKKNIQTEILNSGVNVQLLPILREEIVRNYRIKDWTKFDYITVELPVSHVIWFVIAMIAIQAGLHYWILTNGESKFVSGLYRSRRFV